MPRNKHTLTISRAEFQKLKGNFQESLQRKNVLTDKRCKEAKDGYHNQCFIFITFQISDNRPRDLDGMAATILDCLTKSGRIQDDKRQIVSRLFVDYELCEKGQEGFRVRIIT